MFEQRSETRKYKGHYGNEITTLSVSVRRRSAGAFLQRLLKLLSADERYKLIRDLDNRIDADGRLYLRLDKQKCFQGRLSLADQDPIRCEFSFEIEHADVTSTSGQIKRFLGSIINL